MKYIIYLEDTDPDTGAISQKFTCATATHHQYAMDIVEILSKKDDMEPNRVYKFSFSPQAGSILEKELAELVELRKEPNEMYSSDQMDKMIYDKQNEIDAANLLLKLTKIEIEEILDLYSLSILELVFKQKVLSKEEFASHDKKLHAMFTEKLFKLIK